MKLKTLHHKTNKPTPGFIFKSCFLNSSRENLRKPFSVEKVPKFLRHLLKMSFLCFALLTGALFLNLNT